MYKLTIIACLFIASFSLHAFDGEYQPMKETINVSHLSPTPLIMKKSILRVLIQNNWIIKEHTRNMISATYREALIKVILNGQTVTLAEIEKEYGNNGDEFHEGWMSSLKRHFIKDITFHYHIAKAEQQLNL